MSYVLYMNERELVSASTDSTLRLWNGKGGPSLRKFSGHLNEKNFVGLSCEQNFVACGSETSEVITARSFCLIQTIICFQHLFPTPITWRFPKVGSLCRSKSLYTRSFPYPMSTLLNANMIYMCCILKSFQGIILSPTHTILVKLHIYL